MPKCNLHKKVTYFYLLMGAGSGLGDPEERLGELMPGCSHADTGEDGGSEPQPVGCGQVRSQKLLHSGLRHYECQSHPMRQEEMQRASGGPRL